MSDYRFHDPDAVELAFLRIVTHGYLELTAQIESCEVDDFDSTGYCDVHVISGPSLGRGAMCDGPSLVDREDQSETDTILWVNDSGYLYSIEIVGYGQPLGDVYARFIKAASCAQLRYKNGSAE
ncbi:MAG: hypothetical protein ACRDUW_17710 [Pseudonocardiaceae bacterium]